MRKHIAGMVRWQGRGRSWRSNLGEDHGCLSVCVESYTCLYTYRLYRLRTTCIYYTPRGDEVLGERHIQRLVLEGVYKAFLKDGVAMIADRRIEVVKEEGVEGRKGNSKVKRFLLSLDMCVLICMS